MKKLKLKSKIKNKTVKESPLKIQQLIFEDIKNINKFNIIIEQFILSLQNNDGKNIKEISAIIYEIYEYFFVKNKKIISDELVNFLEEKLNLVLKVFIEVIDIDNAEEESDSYLNTKIILKDIIRFVKYSSESSRDFILNSLTKLFICNDELIEPSQISILTKSFQNKKYFPLFFDIIFKFMNENFQDITSEILFNIYNFMVSTGKISNIKIKPNYQNILIQLINQVKLPKDILKNLLLNLNKFMFENLENPLIFSDYLINIYERCHKEEFDIKVLSLSGLFVLITKYKLDYADYYSVLYKTISIKYLDCNSIKTVLDSKYRNRFFKILELSLKSNTVPIIVILSFIKKLARVCLHTSSNNIVIILGIIQNLIKLHPRSVLLLIRKKNISDKLNGQHIDIKKNSMFDWSCMNLSSKNLNEENKQEETSNQNNLNNIFMDDQILNINNSNEPLYDTNSYSLYDQFNDDEIDPYKTNANFSCLWELYTIKNHFSFKIRNITNKFETNFIKGKEFDMNTVSDIKDEDMFYELTQTSNFYINMSNSNVDNFSQIENKIKNFI